MNATTIISHRLYNQQLGAPELTSAADVVKSMIAMQAQEFAMAKWAIGLRMKKADDTLIETAFNNGEILRTHAVRPTWHFVAPEDIRWLLKLTAPRINALGAYMYRQTGLDTKLFNRCNTIIAKELEGGKFLMRTELQKTLETKKIIASGHKLSYIMMRAEIDGIICSGPRKGKQFTYALLEERVPPIKAITRKEALANFTQRYFSSRGPATAKDFASWSGLSMTDVKDGIASLPKQFIREKYAEQEYIYEDKPIPKKLHKHFLMPIYDEYGMSYKNRSHLFDSAFKPKDTTIFNNMIVMNGVVVGGWNRTWEGKKLIVDTVPFGKVSKVALDREIKRFRNFTSAS